MLVGGLIIAPLLAYMGTGIKVGKEVYEERMAELYAADAGIEDALWCLKIGGQTDVPPFGFTLNTRPVNVTVEAVGASVYKITSKATSADGSKTTTIVSYTKVLPSLLDNVVTSTTKVTIKGDVQPPEKIVCPYPEDMWTQATEGLAAYYWDEVKNKIPYASGILNVKDTPVIGPTYTNGDLNIEKTGSTGNTLLKLQGTLYVKGNLETDQNKEFTIDLNGQTIFVEDGINIGGSKTTITGSGCLIAVGDIKFQPTVSSSPADFIFIMSINGTITAQPHGEFYGSFAGDVEVQTQPGSTITWSDPSGENLNLPPGGLSGMQIKTWEISLQQED
jgi:hypothetical protein